MYVRHETNFHNISKDVVDCVIGMISNSGFKLFTTLHAPLLHPQILVQKPQVPFIIIKGYWFQIIP